MKKGKTITELAAELERQQEAKQDYVADTRTLTLETDRIAEDSPAHERYGDTSRSKLSVVDLGEFGVTSVAHEQIGGRLNIPRKFYERLRYDHPALLDHNVNTLFREKPEKRMVRTLDGNARAFLSDRYRRLDNFELANAVLPVLGEMPDVEFVSTELTERRMYIKALLPRIQGEIGVGEFVQAGVVISNSEVGSGALSVRPLVYKLACKNGMIVADATAALRRYHVGRRIESDEENAYAIFRDETLRQDDKALFMKVSDVIKAAADEAVFQQVVAGLRDLADTKIEGDVVESVEKLNKRVGLNEGEGSGVLRHLVEGGDLSQWGYLNAVTRQSQDVEDYDRATDLEALGGEIAVMSAREFTAAAA